MTTSKKAPTGETPAAPPSKIATHIELLTKATGWQPHSVRGAPAGTLT
ncbi:hypothetical protein [Rhodophyticola porphyridii]|nr:hypothetical protein [Rhodophyticola porphyridii]